MRSESADQVPREQGCCLLIRSGSYVQLVDQQKDDTEIPDKTINRETELTQNGQSTNGKLVGQGYYRLSMKPGSMSRMLRCALQIFFIFSIMSLDSMSPPFPSARYARQ